MLAALVFVSLVAAARAQCDPRYFDQDSFVCVCSASYCDLPGVISTPAAGLYTAVTSSRDSDRFTVNTANITDTATGGTLLVVDPSTQYQTMMGFGGSFTDATGLNVLTLPVEAQDMLLRSYFSPEGLQYSLCRVPIAGSDFSTRPYSYDDVEGDVTLQYFNLTYEDYVYKLPMISRAQELSEREVQIFGSPWSPPAWMKENGMFNGSGGLLPEMWQPWSDYFVKFVQAYEAEGVPIWGLTTQNEPLTGFEDWYWNTCAWSAEDQRDWIKTNLGPTLEAAGLRRVMLMVLDHNRDLVPSYPATILEDVAANQYVDGTALHWYADWADPNNLDQLQALFPDKFILYTESCEGWYAAPDQRVMMGDWSRAQNYASNIIEDVNHWSTGWVDWNMALDMQGGPNWANNFVDSPIIIDTGNGVFYKQPMFYAMGHFSKFVEPAAKRVYVSSFGSDTFELAAFNNPNNTTTVVVLNKGEAAADVSVDTNNGAQFINLAMPPKSITTLLFATPA